MSRLDLVGPARLRISLAVLVLGKVENILRGQCYDDGSHFLGIAKVDVRLGEFRARQEVCHLVTEKREPALIKCLVMHRAAGAF